MSDAALVLVHPQAKAVTQESGKKKKKNVPTTDAVIEVKQKKKKEEEKTKPRGASLSLTRS